MVPAAPAWRAGVDGCQLEPTAEPWCRCLRMQPAAPAARGLVPIPTVQGDSGSPLIWKGPGGDVAVGITSWGAGCASETPGVYADVAAASNWIRDTIQVGGAEWDACRMGSLLGLVLL